MASLSQPPTLSWNCNQHIVRYPVPDESVLMAPDLVAATEQVVELEAGEAESTSAAVVSMVSDVRMADPTCKSRPPRDPI